VKESKLPLRVLTATPKVAPSITLSSVRTRVASERSRSLDERWHAHHNTTTTHDSAHDITQYRLERRDIVGITSLLTESIPATVSIPLAGRTTAQTRPHLSTTSVSRHQRATRIGSIKATAGITSTVRTKWRIEGLRETGEEARLTQIAPCYRGGRRQQQRKSSTKSAANCECCEEQCTRVILACTRT
jgi:hypothetical protein